MTEKEHAYRLILSDLEGDLAKLEKERAEVEGLIRQIRKRLPEGSPGESKQAPYAGMKSGEATMAYLRDAASSEPMTTREIVTGLVSGGYVFKGGRDPYGPVAAALSRFTKFRPDTVKKVGTKWILTEHDVEQARRETDGSGREKREEP